MFQIPQQYHINHLKQERLDYPSRTWVELHETRTSPDTCREKVFQCFFDEISPPGILAENILSSIPVVRLHLPHPEITTLLPGVVFFSKRWIWYFCLPPCQRVCLERDSGEIEGFCFSISWDLLLLSWFQRLMLR